MIKFFFIFSLTEIIILCTKCLLVFSPKLIDLLTEIEFIPSKWQPLIEIQFGAPKLNVDTTMPQLTFGILLSAVGIFTKSLNLVIKTIYFVFFSST